MWGYARISPHSICLPKLPKPIPTKGCSNQPAKAAGIKADDVIAKIDGKNAATLPLEAIRAILQSGDGKTVLLTIRRQYDILEIPLVLKRNI